MALPIRLREFSISQGACPSCGWSVFVRLFHDETGVRCIRCRATPITLSLITVLNEVLPDMTQTRAYELSSRGALVRFLQHRVGKLTTSEYFDDVSPGEFKAGIQCQDAMRLTYEDAQFDLCTSTEVFEHIPDAIKGFREIHRVLAPKGLFVFTVPLSGQRETITRARLTADGIDHILPPEYHSDRIRGDRKVLCFRLFGDDIADQLLQAGFWKAWIQPPNGHNWFGFSRRIVLAAKK